MTDGLVRVIGEALLDVLPGVYGHRTGGPAVLEGTALGRDAAAIAAAVRSSGARAVTDPEPVTVALRRLRAALAAADGADSELYRYTRHLLDVLADRDHEQTAVADVFAHALLGHDDTCGLGRPAGEAGDDGAEAGSSAHLARSSPSPSSPEAGVLYECDRCGVEVSPPPGSAPLDRCPTCGALPVSSAIDTHARHVEAWARGRRAAELAAGRGIDARRLREELHRAGSRCAPEDCPSVDECRHAEGLPSLDVVETALRKTTAG